MEEIKAVVQQDFAECIQQISLYPPGCEALQADGALLEAVAALADNAWAEETKDSARRTLMILKPEEVVRHSVRDVDSLHVMMSCAFHSISRM